MIRKNYFVNPIRKRFIDAFPKFKNDDPASDKAYFYEAWLQSPFYNENLTETDLKDIYNHLLADYYDWHFIYPDDLGITLNTFKIIDEYYPNVKVRLELVKELRNMTVEEFEKSGITISSQGQNPKIRKEMDELIDFVDSQNASFQLKSKEQTLRAKFMSLYDGVMDEFISRFKPLFVKLYSGVNDYIYINCEEEGNDEY